jgi:hypothetical protein
MFCLTRVVTKTYVLRKICFYASVPEQGFLTDLGVLCRYPSVYEGKTVFFKSLLNGHRHCRTQHIAHKALAHGR